MEFIAFQDMIIDSYQMAIGLERFDPEHAVDRQDSCDTFTQTRIRQGNRVVSAAADRRAAKQYDIFPVFGERIVQEMP